MGLFDFLKSLFSDQPSDSVIKGAIFSCSLDEKTCLKCLELDGTKNPPTLPIHSGCRCITIPITKTWAELGVKVSKGGPFSDEAMELTSSDGIYKDYLIERAKALERGLKKDELAKHLKSILPVLKKKYPKDKSAFIRIKARLFELQPGDDLKEIKAILNGLSWDSKQFSSLFKHCAELNRFDLIEKTLKDKIKIIPTGLFDLHAKYNLYRTAGNSVKKYSLEKAIEYCERAFKFKKNYIGVIVELGKLYRRTKRTEDAKKMFIKALKIKPDHKEAKRELERLSKL